MKTKTILLRALTLALTLSSVTGGEPVKHAAKLKAIDQIAGKGPFQPNWDSLARYQVPEWYKDAKFGIFIHWGVYSVPAFGSEWYPREMYDPANSGGKGDYQHHIKTHGRLDEFGYKDFIPMFKAEKFDPVAWAKLFKESGAKYVIPVAEHHDGFPMYDCSHTDWNAAKMGPKRDVIAELSEAVRKESLIFGVSSHRVENWWYYGEGRKVKSDVTDDRYRDLYGPAADRKESEDQKTPPNQAFLQDWLLRTCELVDKYHPQVIWFDWWIAQPAVQPYLKQFASYYYNRGAQWGEGVAINYKKLGGETFPDTAGVLDIERGQLAKARDLLWQTDTSVSKTSWGYVANQQFRTVNSLVDDLVDIVSKNGCLLLNIGPRADGTIPEQEQQILLKMGGWLSMNGEAIYSTRPWKVFGEGPTRVMDGTMRNDAEKHQLEFGSQDFRFTKKGDVVYVIGLQWPAGETAVTVKSLGKDAAGFSIKNVELLGHRGTLHFNQDNSGLKVTLPGKAPCDYAYVLRCDPQDPLASRQR
jgi:alpha-L-fucosidase